MGIRENILKIRKIYGLSQKDLADIAGVSDKAVSTWENGIKEPRMGSVQKIADHFGLLKSNLIEDNGLDNVGVSVSPEELVSSNIIVEEDGSRKTPLFESLSTTIPLEKQPPKEYIELPSFVFDKFPNAFLLKVTDNLMDKIVPEGAYALINPCDPSDASIVAMAEDGEDFKLRRFYHQGKVTSFFEETNNGSEQRGYAYLDFDFPKITTIPAKIEQYFTDIEERDFDIHILGEMVWYLPPLVPKY